MYHVVTMGDVTPGSTPASWSPGAHKTAETFLEGLGATRTEALAAGVALGLLLGVAGVLAFRR